MREYRYLYINMLTYQVRTGTYSLFIELFYQIINNRYGQFTSLYPPGVIVIFVIGEFHDSGSISSIYDMFLWWAYVIRRSYIIFLGREYASKPRQVWGRTKNPRGVITMKHKIRWHEYTCRRLYFH